MDTQKECKRLSSHTELWTIGVEEEYQIIDPTTRALCGDAEHLLSYMQSTPEIQSGAELQHAQLEIATPICQTLADVRTALVQGRQAVLQAATQARRWVAAAGTHPFSRWQDQEVSTSKARYRVMQMAYQQLVREQVIFGCHVHIGCTDRDLAIQIVNRARLWLAPLLALTTNSPFWCGDDTGYGSFRTEIWSRWPMAGPPSHITSQAEYDEFVRMLIATGSIKDTTHLYWDMRLSDRYPTIEFRIMDVCTTIDETVMITGLARALAQTCYEQEMQQISYTIVSNDLLRAAHWRAARYGLDADLIDLEAGISVPAHEHVAHLLELLRPVLERNGEWDEIVTLVQAVLQNGTGASRQRAVYQHTGTLQDVVDFTVLETTTGLQVPAGYGFSSETV